ncbi:hypothetical protein LSAT2_017776 [Lamellibrachia satsuma]|nr:hypothetical protein LSAT2_017776 [Lamellibrachia satsuma]
MHLSWGLADRSGEVLFLPYTPVIIVKRDFTAFRADLSQVLIVNLAGVLREDWHRQDKVVIPSAHDK